MTKIGKKISDKLSIILPGELNVCGYCGKLVRYTIDEQLTDVETWKIFVEQFRLYSDHDKCWRGEYWGKMMRGGVLTYVATKDRALYDALTDTVKDLLSSADENGRISTYPPDNELIGWDMWVRKYVILGLEYYYDICDDDRLKKQILDALVKEADYIVKRIGNAEGQKSIFETSQIYGGLNSCSILEPFVKLYGLTGYSRFFDFATMLIESGLCKDFNLIQTFLSGKTPPYKLKHTKAYEMMSCMEGVLEYYEYTGKKELLTAVENFVGLVLETDYTLIGSCGCTHELFDNSTARQTEYSEEVMQETCVTVTLMKLCFKLLLLTGKAEYARVIEHSALNAMFGAVNNEKQTMKRADAMVYSSGYPEKVEHEPYPFDSYSPLYINRRGRKIGGFKKMQHGRSYGCCACIGSAGTAIAALCVALKNANCLFIERFCDFKLDAHVGKVHVKVCGHADEFCGDKSKFIVDSDGATDFAVRIPKKATSFSATIDGEKAEGKIVDGYFIIENRKWNGEKIEIFCPQPVTAESLNGKIAFTKGEVVLARDCRLDEIDKPVRLKNDEPLVYEKFSNQTFESNVAFEITTENGKIKVCDYAQAGKNYDDENCNITVWQNT